MSEESSRARAFGLCGAAYLTALVVAVAVAYGLRGQHPIAVVLWADLAATATIFGWSLACRNTSFYDAYWSVAPMVIAVYWWLHPTAAGPLLRQLAVVALVWLWGARLTFNWARGWRGLSHQDWRYVNIQNKTGAWYWPVSFLGLHMFPTVQVFLGCLALYPALVLGARPVGWLDGLAFAVTAAGVALEAIADQQLRRFVLSRPAPEDILDRGLWAYSRHPNYLGEMLFWWGLALFAVAAAEPRWWFFAGAASISVMFLCISIPMIDKRMLERRPGYADHKKRVSGLLLWPPKPR